MNPAFPRLAGYCATLLLFTAIGVHADVKLPGIFSDNLMLQREYPNGYRLKPDLQAIRMPNVFLCFLAALVPPVWHDLIIKRALKQWDEQYASAEERELARAQNRDAGWPDWLGATR